MIFLGGYNNYSLKLLCNFRLRVRVEDSKIAIFLGTSGYTYTVVHILGSNATVHDISRCGRLELGSYEKTCELNGLILCRQHYLTCTKLATLVPTRAR